MVDWVVIRVDLLKDQALGPEEIDTYLRAKVALPIPPGREYSLRVLKQKGLIEKPSRVKNSVHRGLSPLGKPPELKPINLAQGVIPQKITPFYIRWAALVTLFENLHHNLILLFLPQYMEEKLKEKAVRAGIELTLPDAWYLDQNELAEKLFQQCPKEGALFWIEVIDWFMQDEFWTDQIVSLRGVSKHLSRFISWKSKSANPKAKTLLLRVIR